MDVDQSLRVFVYAADPLSQAGITALLRGRGGLRLVDGTEVDLADVALVVVDTVDAATVRVLGAVQRDRIPGGRPRIVLVVSEIDPAGAAEALQAGAAGIVRRATVTADGLVSAIGSVASGEGVVPSDLLDGLLRRRPAEPPAAAFGRPTEREVQVLRLLSEGCDTREVARMLSYSERTVKNVIQDVTRRFGLRNRSHAVAFALREGLI
ncbi:LuxR C-terminal-related transcriptional regulator [Dactylosporangium sp. NPDC049525]|uniref:helix-turn-helix transcriptional regulator n=1 Tax=Dactylosporangium sp. NPDC049525 TaxID=3154730 RepID=UPI00343568CE